MTRNGKIARLPRDIRNQLNRRIADGEPGKSLVEWLNDRTLVQETLKEQFDGRPVSEQNLSEWKQGGYQDWLRQEESRALVERLTEEHEGLDQAADGMEISDRFAGVLSVEFVALTKKLLEEKTDTKERWQCLREVFRELSQLRRDDHRAVRTVIKRERWVRESKTQDAEDEKRLQKEHNQRLCAPFWAHLQMGTMAELFGGGERGREIAAFILEIQNGLPMGKLGRKSTAAEPGPPPPASPAPNPTESNSIKPNQTS